MTQLLSNYTVVSNGVCVCVTPKALRLVYIAVSLCVRLCAVPLLLPPLSAQP